MTDIRVQARADHVASLASASPLAALEELVWNALDADAHTVTIDLITNTLGAVEAIRLSDDGHGIDRAQIEATFGGLGGSWKREPGAMTPDRRRLHGRHGCGRFKAFALGHHVEWRTTSGDPLTSFVLSGDLDEPGLFHLEDRPTGPACGTEVYITNIRPTADALTNAALSVQTLAAKFALYLKSYPSVKIYFCGLPVTPVIVQKAATSYKVTIPSGAEAKLEVIEWRRRFPGAGKLVLCGGDGFALREQMPGVRPGAAFSFTAYLVSPRLAALEAENMLVMDELNPEVCAYLDATKKILRDHFRVRAVTERTLRVKEWIEEGSYPFDAEDLSPRRAAFDAAVDDMRLHLDGLDALSTAERSYLFALLIKTLPTDL